MERPMRITIPRIFYMGMILFLSLCFYLEGCHKKPVNNDKVGAVEGFVKDSQSQIPIVGADVFLDDEPYIYFPKTDSTGYYKVGIPLGDTRLVKISIKSQGYKAQDKNIILKPNQIQRLDFFLVKEGES
jgi:hypothetical protein